MGGMRKETYLRKTRGLRYKVHCLVQSGMDLFEAIGRADPRKKKNVIRTGETWEERGAWPIEPDELELMVATFGDDPEYNPNCVSTAPEPLDDHERLENEHGEGTTDTSPVSQPKKGTTDTNMSPNTVARQVTHQEADPVENANSDDLRDVLSVNTVVLSPETEPVSDETEKELVFTEIVKKEIIEMHTWWQKHKEEIRNPALAAERRPLLKRKGKTKGKDNAVTKTVRLARDLTDDVETELKTPENIEKYGGSLSGLVETLLWQWLGSDPKYLVNQPEPKQAVIFDGE